MVVVLLVVVVVVIVVIDSCSLIIEMDQIFAFTFACSLCFPIFTFPLPFYFCEYAIIFPILIRIDH